MQLCHFHQQTQHYLKPSSSNHRYQSRICACLGKSSGNSDVDHLSRRNWLSALSIPFFASSSSAAEGGFSSGYLDQRQNASVDYFAPGPFRSGRFPRLEHTCASCFPACTGSSCLLGIQVIYPRGSAALEMPPPYPLAIITGGFLVDSDAYRSYAERLASWGYITLLYDKRDSVVGGVLDDVSCVALLSDLISWAHTDPLLSRLSDTRRVLLLGHSRGGKISALTAAVDDRVAALVLLDPVDNTVYAPLAPGYPSALEALRNPIISDLRPSLPVAVIGSELGGGCAPPESNFERFFDAAPGPVWELLIKGAGHLQFQDDASPFQRVVCPPGDVTEGAVRDISATVTVAWAQTVFRHPAPASISSGLDITWSRAAAASQVAPVMTADPTDSTLTVPCRLESLTEKMAAVSGLGLRTRFKNF